MEDLLADYCKTYDETKYIEKYKTSNLLVFRNSGIVLILVVTAFFTRQTPLLVYFALGGGAAVVESIAMRNAISIGTIRGCIISVCDIFIISVAVYAFFAIDFGNSFARIILFAAILSGIAIKLNAIRNITNILRKRATVRPEKDPTDP